MVCVHRSCWWKGAESMERKYENDFAYGKKDDLSNSRWLHSANCDTPNECQQKWDEGERRSPIGIGVIECPKKKHCRQIIKEVVAWPGRSDKDEQPDREP